MRGRAGLACAALALIGVMALAVFPAQAWMNQRQERTTLVALEAALAGENRALRARSDQLRTDEEIERLARQYNLIKPGEEAFFILPRATAPTVAPAPAPEPTPREPQSLWERITAWF